MVKKAILNLKEGIENNKIKFAFLLVYIFIVFILPFQFVSPSNQAKLETIQKKFVSKAADSSFRNDIALLRKGNINQLFLQVDPYAEPQISTSSLAVLAKNFASTTNQIDLVDYHQNTQVDASGTATNYYTTYQVQNNDTKYKYLLVGFQAQNTNSGIKIDQISYEPIEESLSEANKFNPSQQWPYLFLSILVPLFIVYTAFRYLMKPQVKWIPFLLILLLNLYFYSQVGNMGATIGLFGFMAKEGEWNPWTFFVPLPIGAILYYFLWRKDIVVDKSEDLATAIDQE